MTVESRGCSPSTATGRGTGGGDERGGNHADGEHLLDTAPAPIGSIPRRRATAPSSDPAADPAGSDGSGSGPDSSDGSDGWAADPGQYARWLHDAVLPELSLLRLKVNSGSCDIDTVLTEIDAIEHRLRERQLDAELATDGVPLVTVLQPYIRMAQRAHVRITEVPNGDVAARMISGTVGYELKRFLSVAVPNALLAGATKVGFHLEPPTGPDDDGHFALTISDDAGGIPDDPAHHGRGRTRLADDLGPDRLTTTTDDHGTHFTCHF